jgi:hypothetical protein
MSVPGARQSLTAERRIALHACGKAPPYAARMTPESADFAEKLRQMEEQANSVAAELLPGLAKTRLLHIVILATTLRVRLEFGRVAVVREPD